MRKLAALMSVAAVFVFASPAYANTGLPMIVVMWPLMMLALLPIIAIEAYVLSTRLAMSIGQAVSTAAWANGISTVVGIPITWILLLFFPVIRKAAWILPFPEEYDMDPELVVPVSALGLLVPFFLTSWLIECRIAVGRLPELDAGTVCTAVFVGNAITYAGLAGLIVVAWLWEMARGKTEMYIPIIEVPEDAYEDEEVGILEPVHDSETAG